MSGLSDILTTVQQGVIAANNLATQLSGSVLTIARTPTTGTLTAGTSATYTPTSTSVKWFGVLMVGGGGGGVGLTNATSAVIVGTSGQTTMFSSWGANGGSGGPASATAGLSNYADGGTGGPGTAFIRIPGQNSLPTAINNQAYNFSYAGGDSVLGRGAGVTRGSFPQGGLAAAANSGGGGSGSWGGVTVFVQGPGGGGGEFVYVIIPNTSSSYLYTVGAGGAGGVGVTATGGAGGSGVIYVNEYYAG